MQTYGFTDTAILTDSYWLKIEACYSRTWDSHDMPPHFHNRAEIMYVLNGWCNIHLYEYQLEESTQKILIKRRWTERLVPGEFIFLDQGVLHQLEVQETSYMLNVEFKFVPGDGMLMTMKKLAEGSPNLKAMLERKQKIIRGRDDAGEMVRPLSEVNALYSQPGQKDTALMDVVMAELLLRLSANTKEYAIKSNSHSYVRRAMDYIESHLCEDIRVADIAGIVGIAPAHLQRVFKQAVGMTIVEYTNQLRIEQSKRLLLYTDDSVLDIALASGFNSRQHFFRVFNTIEGISPQQYRQENHPKHSQQIYRFENINDVFVNENDGQRL